MATPIPLLVLLAASLVLAAAHGEAAATTNIRLPSDDVDGQTDRPWDCCDNIERSLLTIFPPFYRCNDEVKQCAAACKECEEAPGDFPRAYICRDWYQTTDPGPFCTERPWGKCCDTAQCTKSIPPTCRCMDEVKRCAAACTECRRVKSSSKPPRYVCLDQFTGQPGPRCTPADTHN